MRPAYDIDKIKFPTDPATFEKAVGLYENGKVTQFKEGIGAYSAVVIGTKPYRVQRTTFEFSTLIISAASAKTPTPVVSIKLKVLS